MKSCWDLSEARPQFSKVPKQVLTLLGLSMCIKPTVCFSRLLNWKLNFKKSSRMPCWKLDTHTCNREWQIMPILCIRDVCVKKKKKVWRGTVGANALLQHAVHFAYVHCICVLPEEPFRDIHCMKPLPTLCAELLLHTSYSVSQKKPHKKPKTKRTSPTMSSKHSSHFRILAWTCKTFKYLLVDKKINLLVGWLSNKTLKLMLQLGKKEINCFSAH